MELTLPDDVPALVAASITSASIETWVGGVRRVDDPTPVVAGDRFHLGSNAKAMTATVTALAVDQGRLRWEDDAADVLGRGQARGATIERLLSHTAGVLPLTEDADLVGLSRDRLEVAAFLLEEPPRFEPGTAAEYANGGYAVISAVLERVFGAPFEVIVAERLFDPLGMEAGFGWPTGPRGHYARGGRLDAQTEDGYAVPPALTGAGDVCSTIDGYAQFVQCHLRGLRGNPGLLSVDSFGRLHTPVDGNFALGWGVQEWEGERTSVHAGSAETFYAVVVLQPEHDFAAAAIVNAGGENAAGRSIDIVRALARLRADERVDDLAAVVGGEGACGSAAEGVEQDCEWSRAGLRLRKAVAGKACELRSLLAAGIACERQLRAVSDPGPADIDEPREVLLHDRDQHGPGPAAGGCTATDPPDAGTNSEAPGRPNRGTGGPAALDRRGPNPVVRVVEVNRDGAGGGGALGEETWWFRRGDIGVSKGGF